MCETCGCGQATETEESKQQQPTQASPSQGTNPNTMAMLCHLSALALYVGIPFGNILGPLIIWLIKKDEMPEVNEAGKEALNFQISVTIYFFVSFILMFVLIGIPLMIAVGIFNLVMVIVASVKANDGQAYRYPLCIRMIK